MMLTPFLLGLPSFFLYYQRNRHVMINERNQMSQTNSPRMSCWIHFLQFQFPTDADSQWTSAKEITLRYSERQTRAASLVMVPFGRQRRVSWWSFFFWRNAFHLHQKRSHTLGPWSSDYTFRDRVTLSENGIKMRFLIALSL